MVCLDNKHAGPSGPACPPVGCIPDTSRIAEIYLAFLSPTEIICVVMAAVKTGKKVMARKAGGAGN